MGYPEGSTTARGREKRSDILDAAMAEFTQHGYTNASLSKIASRAHISKSGLLHHFSEKSALLEAVLSERTFVRRHPDRVYPVQGVLGRLALNAEVKFDDIEWARFRTIMVAESLTADHPAFAAWQARYRRFIDSSMDELRTDYPGVDERAAEQIATLAIAVLDGMEIQLALLGNVDTGGAFGLFREMADAYLSGMSTFDDDEKAKE